MSAHPPTVIRALYRAATSMAPRRVRQQYAAEQAELFERLWVEERPRPILAGVWWTTRMLARAAIAALGAHRDGRRADGAWPWTPGRTLIEFRHALRFLLRAPWYTAATVLVMGSSMALAVSVFAVVDGVLFRPLPFPNADRLFFVRVQTPANRGVELPAVSGREIAAWLDAVPGLPLAVLRSGTGGAFERIDGRNHTLQRVDSAFFDVVGQRPLMGGFEPADFALSASMLPPAFTPVMLSHRLWVARFGADPAIVGTRRVVAARRGVESGYLVRGVLPPEFVFPLDQGQEAPDVLVPEYMRSVPGWRESPSPSMQVMVRAPVEMDVETLRGRLHAARLAIGDAPTPVDAHQREHGWTAPAPVERVDLVPVARHLGADERAAFRMVTAGVALLLLLAAVNVAGLTAARGVQRWQDLAIRRALGASDAALARALMAEVLLVVAAATTLALAGAGPMMRLTLSLLPDTTTLVTTPAIDARAIAAAAAIATAMVVLVAIWPLVAMTRAGRVVPGSVSGSGSAAGDSRAARRGRLAILAVQAGAGFVLLTAGALTLSSLAAVWRADAGYDGDRIALLEMFSTHYADMADAGQQVRAAIDAVGSRADVVAVAATSLRAFSGLPGVFTSVVPEGAGAPPEGLAERRVDRAFFDIVGLPVTQGAMPSADDWVESNGVAVVSEQAAHMMWGSRSPIGRRIVARRPNPQRPLGPFEVVAVVGDAKFAGPDREPVGDIYLPGAITPDTYGSFAFVRTQGPARLVAGQIGAAVAARGLRVERAVSLDAALTVAAKPRALPAWLFGSLGIVALWILAVGVLGVVAMTAAQRTREMAIRRVLGSTSGGVMRLLARDQVIAVGAGVLCGAAVSTWSVRMLESQLYKVAPYDSTVWIGSAAVMMGVAVVGSVLPARRALQVDPAGALRAE